MRFAAPSPNADAQRSAGQTVDDASITAKVKNALLKASEVEGTAVNVDTVNGAVDGSLKERSRRDL
jgi:osmotically-inducible protein OsmY